MVRAIYGAQYNYNQGQYYYGMSARDKKVFFDSLYGFDYGFMPAPQMAPSHSCAARTSDMSRKFHEGVVEYHRKRGVDVKTLRNKCADPACMLARIKS